MRNTLIAAAAAALIGASLNSPASAAPDNYGDGYPHCKSEDAGTHCTWNVGLPIDGNGQGQAFYRDRHGRAHYAPDCFTLMAWSYRHEFPRKARRTYRLCLRNTQTVRLVRRGSDADMARAVRRQHHHTWYVGHYAQHRHVWMMPGATSVFIGRDWYVTS